MRSNSGRDEKRNNLRDPTLRDKQDRAGRPVEKTGGQSTTGLGSGDRKSGQEGESG